MKEEIILIGGGGHCKSVIDVIELEDKYKIAGIIDKQELVGDNVLGYPIIGTDNDLEKLRKNFSNAFITIGQIRSNILRFNLFKILKELAYNLPKIISPLSYISKNVQIGEGTIVMHHALINIDAKIGSNCIVNTKALIEHDCIVEDHCHISTGAILNGGVILKENSFFGTGAIIFQGKFNKPLIIGKNAVIAAGSVVTKNVPEGMTVFGNPAIQFNKENLKRRG